jgi:hypothetical protein
MVYVATEDGFEMPTSTGDIILMNPETKAEKMFSEDFNVDLAKTAAERADHDVDISQGKIKPGAEESPGYYLAFVPSDQQWFITGELEVRLVNHSRNDILYNLLLQDDNGDYFGFDYGSVESGSSVSIESIDREALPGWTDGIVQIIVHAEDDAFLPLQSSFHIKASKFSSEGSYQKSGLMQESAILYKLAEVRSGKKMPKKHEAAKKVEEPVEIKAIEHKKESLIGKHATGPHAAVVDLHIGEIVDNIAGASRVNSGKERGPRREACQRCTDCIGKYDPAFSEPLDIRRDRLRVALKHLVPIVPVVDVQKQNAGPIGLFCVLSLGYLKQ